MNQMTAPDSEQKETHPPSIAAGQRLRAAREGLGLSREDVARELRLQEKLIGALEEGDRSQLPPAAFISGYLRAYARLLGLPPEELIAQYLAEGVTPSSYRTTDRTGMPKMTSSDPRVKLFSFAVFAVTALLFAAWWANQRFSLISLDTVVQKGAETVEHQELDAKLPESVPLYQDPPSEEPLPGQEQGVAPLSSGSADTPASKTAPAPAVTAAPPAAATITPATSPVETAKPEPTVATRPLSASVPQSSLVMEYQAACWTQVEDARGRMLVYETVAAGRKLQLQGVAPFKVYLGYAPGVQVYYNGTLFPHADYHRGDLARFKVGSSQDNRPLVR